MANYYKGNKLLNNNIVNYYIKGLYFDKANGKKLPLQEGTNKYNAKFVQQINELNVQFYALIRANNILLKLLKMHSKAAYSDIGAVYGLIKTQSGTIKYNKVLKSALKTYEIRHQKIYDELKRDLASQEDRIKRNRELVNKNISDFGLDCIKEFIYNTTGSDIVDHILHYTDEYNKDIEYRPQLSDKTAEEYYEELDNSYIKYLLDNAETSGVNLFNQISDNLKQHHKYKEQTILKAKQAIAEKKAEEKKAKAMNAIGNDNNLLNSSINNCVYGGGKDNLGNRFSLDTALSLREIVDNFGGIGYYIALCSASTVKYLGKNLDVVGGITKALWLASEETAKELVEVLKTREELSKMHISIQNIKIISKIAAVQNEAKYSNSVNDSGSGSDSVKLNNTTIREVILERFNEQLKQANIQCKLLNKHLVDTLTHEVNIEVHNIRNLSGYKCNPHMKFITLYNIRDGAQRIGRNIRYVGFICEKKLCDYTDKQKGVEFTYKDCNGIQKTIYADIQLNMNNVLALSIIERYYGSSYRNEWLEPTVNKMHIEKLIKTSVYRSSKLKEIGGKWEVYPYTTKVNMTNVIYNCEKLTSLYFNQFISELQIPIEIFEEVPIRNGLWTTIKSVKTHKELLKKLNKLRNKNRQDKAYIILATDGVKKEHKSNVKFLRESSKYNENNRKNFVLDDIATPSLCIFNSYNDAMMNIPDLIKQRDSLLYFVYEIDLTIL